MLTITIPGQEFWDEKQEMFVYSEELVITIEHSLASIAEWESKYHKPFIGTEKTESETIDYIRMMTVNDGVPESAYWRLTKKNFDDINSYMSAPMTATWFREDPKKPTGKDVITAEIIYYWMVSLQIPFECQYWHLQRLLTLVRVCNEKNKPPKKMSKNDIYSRNRSLNAARRKKLNSRG